MTNHGLCAYRNIYKADRQAEGRTLKSRIFSWVFITGRDMKETLKLCEESLEDVFSQKLSGLISSPSKLSLANSSYIHVLVYFHMETNIFNSLDVFSI